MSNLEPGTYRAKVVNYTISTNAKQNPQVEVLFDFSAGEGVDATHHQQRWWGHLSEKALPYTLKNLVTMGYLGKSNEDFAKLADGVEGGMMDLSVEVDLVLDYETNPDTAKKFLKIQWINTPGSGFKAGMTREQAKVKLGTMNIAGQLAMIRQEIGAPAPKKQLKPTGGTAKAANEPPADFDDFSFGDAP